MSMCVGIITAFRAICLIPIDSVVIVDSNFDLYVIQSYVELDHTLSHLLLDSIFIIGFGECWRKSPCDVSA